MNDSHVEPEWLELLRRNSGLALDSEGRWRYATGFVENERVAELFHRGVGVRADGEVTLTVGQMWAYVTCDGPAFFVRALRDGSAELLGGREVELDGAVFGWGPDERLYIWFQGVDGPALVLRAAHQGLIGRLEERGETLWLTVGDRRFPMAMLVERPDAAARPPP